MKSLNAIATLVFWPALAFGGDSGANAPRGPALQAPPRLRPRRLESYAAVKEDSLGRALCMEARCEEPRFRATPDCASLRKPQYQAVDRRL